MQKISFSEITRSGKNNTSISACPESLDKWYCLNGATCFQVKIYDAILYNCWCPSGYQGLRCDYKYVERRSAHEAAVYNSGFQGSKLDRATSGLAQPGSDNGIQHELLTSHQSGKQAQTVAFDLLVLCLLLLAFILFLLCYVRNRRRSTMDNATMDAHVPTGETTDVIQNTGQSRIANERINYDNLSSRLDSTEQEKRPVVSHHQCHFVIQDPPTIGHLEPRKQLGLWDQLFGQEMLPISLSAGVNQR